MSKTYDVHCAYEFVIRVQDVGSAQEAKSVAESGEAHRDGDIVSGPDVVAVLEVTG